MDEKNRSIKNMENKQPHLYPEIKVLDEKERLDRVLRYELNLPEDISKFTASNESRKKFVENWSKIKSEAEKRFAEGETYEIFEVEDQRYILKYYGEDQLVDIDLLLGPTVESSGSFEICILSDPDGVKVDASQTRQGWKNVELGHNSFQRHDIENREKQTLEVAMNKNRINFSVEYTATYEDPVIKEFSNTALVVQKVKAITPVGEITKELHLFNARTAEIHSDLPFGGIETLKAEATDRYLKILGLSPKFIAKIFSNEIKAEDVNSVERAIDLYLKVKNECGNLKEMEIYDHEIFILKTITELLSPMYQSAFYSTVSTDKYESDDGRGMRSVDTNYYHVGTVSIDGKKTKEILSSHSLSWETVKKLEEGGFLWKHPTGIFKERFEGFAMTVPQRVKVAQILLQNEIGLKDPSRVIKQNSYDHGIYNHLIWWKQYEILKRAHELALEVDFGEAENKLYKNLKSQISQLQNCLDTVNSDYAMADSYFSLDGKEDLHERKLHLEVVKHTIEELRPFKEPGIKVDDLTEVDARSLHKTIESVSEILDEKSFKDEYVFEEPVLPIGTRIPARLDVVDGKVSLAIEDAPSEHWRIEKSQGDLAPHKFRQESKTSLFKVEAKLSEISDWSTKIALPEGVSAVESGEYPVEIIEISRKGHKYWKVLVLTPEYLINERGEILTEIRENLPLRNLAREISGEDGLYGMPVDKDGNPCDESEADHWVMYMKYHKWANSYPDAYILTRMQGFRSKSTGTTFEELVKDYNR